MSLIMKQKLLTLSLFSLLFLIPLSNALAFDHIDNINDGISVFFLTHLDNSDYFEVNITHLGEGNFTLFLFDSRPTESFVKAEKTLDSRIYEYAINYSIDDNPYLFHNISESGIYYIQLILVNNGPDTFFLYSNKELTRYYLPLIPGYSVGLTIVVLLLSSTFIITYRKRIFHLKGE
ncbi:MAG: hypothetical protein EAX89_01510 [Candidatus Lokiarchaeota archaeon]|nr:hypothetical protein [Candidatus Lokiarchaeota archaeon]